MKKKCEPGGFKLIKPLQMLSKMRILMFFIVLSMQLSAATYSQNVRLNLSFNNASLTDVLQSIRNQSHYTFVYNVDDIKNVKINALNVSGATLEEALKQCLKGTGFSYVVEDDVIVVRQQQQTAKKYQVSGIVKDDQGSTLPGVTILIKGTTIGTVTDENGKFSLEVPDLNKVTLQFSYIGMKGKEVAVTGEAPLQIVLEENAAEISEVVVTGFFNKTKESFTGSEVTVKAEDLKKVGSLNVIQALSAFDPSMRLVENLEYGSDPNRVPEISIRGENGFDLRSSADDSKTNPNAPLYILDGVEVTAEKVYDLDMNRIDQMTILKDATATALYGSRGANGVIVITTIRPKSGQIRITANANYNVSIPDLRGYNLMNSAEKLEFERLAGLYQDKQGNYEEQVKLDMKYNKNLEEVRKGVDTYWLSKPLRRSLNQRYSLNFEGGDNNFRYGIDLRYDTDKGVMKESGREKIGIGVVFNYNIGQNFFIRNDLMVDKVKAENSPYGNFSTYAKQNPYDRIYDDEGYLVNQLSSGDYNPLVNATLPNFDQSEYTSIQDNFSVDWWLAKSLRLQGRVSYTQKLDKTEVYKSPKSAEYGAETDLAKKGSYYIANQKSHFVDGNITLAYNKVFGVHTLNIGIGSNLTTDQSKGDSYTGTGFASETIDFIGAATQFKENTTPSGSFDKSRMIGFFANVNYGYDNRYFMDLSYRTDGSSKFGKNSRFAPFWAAGVSWNIHKENFWNPDSKNSLKLRASMGSTGSVNFSSSQALTTYYYDFNNEYNGIFGADFNEYGNPSLKWQTTRSYNAGIDWTFWQGRATFNGDGYIKITDNLLLPIDIAPSTGFTSYIENLGQVKNSGLEGRLRINVINNRAKDINWNVTLAAFTNRNRIQKLSNQLEKLNETANKNTNSTKPIRRYETGRSQSALTVVQSAGIDPITGNEVYIKRDGSRTFVYDYRDVVVVGDMNPKVEGTISSNLTWKGFNLYMLFRYKWGAKTYNSTLASKVEGADPRYNADRRVLTERWKKPGDEANYTRIDYFATPYQTTRLVMDDDLFSFESISLSYDLPSKYLNRLYLERMKFIISTTNLFRISTIKQERGTEYPFARAFSAGLNITF